MGKKQLQVRILPPAKKYIEGLTEAEQGAVAADMKTMQGGDFDSVSTKKLKNKIRELIHGVHRITYFKIRDILWFVRGFRKTTNKAPKKEIEYAEKTYSIVEREIEK